MRRTVGVASTVKNGRPLRFLALALGGWTAARVAMLWPAAPVAVAGLPSPSAVSLTLAERSPVSEPIIDSGPAVTLHAGVQPMGSAPIPKPSPPIRARQALASYSRDEHATVTSIARSTAELDAKPAQDVGAVPAATMLAEATPMRASRLRGDAWLIVRPNAGDNLAFGQLGASQAGVRLVYAVDEARTIGLSGRLSTPLRGRGREAALGVDWRPTALPVSLLVEQRIPLDGGPARPAAQLIAGMATRLPYRLQLEAYAQAGAVHRRGGFADGAARLTRPLLTSRVATIDLGAGGWGAAQRDAARLELGPTLGVTLPARGATIRVGADYRVRVAGRARPGSGPALTIGTSF